MVVVVTTMMMMVVVVNCSVIDVRLPMRHQVLCSVH